MFNRGKVMRIAMKGIIVLLAFLGLLINSIQSDNLIESFSYYTLQSNLLIFIFFSVLLALEIKKIPYNRQLVIIKLVLTVGIFITFLIYHFALRPVITNLNPDDYVVGDIRDILLHYAVPIMVFIDFIAFPQKLKLRWTDPLWVSVQPISYLLYTIIYTSLGGLYHLGDEVYVYPYFFLDVARYGYLGVILWSLTILMFYFIIGYLLTFFTNHIHKKTT